MLVVRSGGGAVWWSGRLAARLSDGQAVRSSDDRAVRSSGGDGVGGLIGTTRSGRSPDQVDRLPVLPVVGGLALLGSGGGLLDAYFVKVDVLF